MLWLYVWQKNVEFSHTFANFRVLFTPRLERGECRDMFPILIRTTAGRDYLSTIFENKTL